MSRISTPWPPPIASQRFRLSSNNAFFRSPLTGQVQNSTRPGGHWEFDTQWQILEDARLGQWMALLAQAQEEGATFYWNNYPKARPIAYPLGTGWGTPLVAGAAQTGRTLGVDGLTNGATLLRGDCFAFDNGLYREMHMLTADVTANVLGAAVLTFTPAIRRSPADNAPILLDGHHDTEASRMACEVIVQTNNEAAWQTQGFQMDAAPKLIEIPR